MTARQRPRAWPLGWWMALAGGCGRTFRRLRDAQAWARKHMQGQWHALGITTANAVVTKIGAATAYHGRAQWPPREPGCQQRPPTYKWTKIA